MASIETCAFDAVSDILTTLGDEGEEILEYFSQGIDSYSYIWFIVARQGCTHIALKGEGVGILNVLVLEVVEVDLGEVGVDGDRVVGGEPVVLHAAAAVLA